ncbi:dTMP kinase [Hyphomonas sp.]|uniref:dTMP kinase n=1 Tax=Hyphomonas sp. TaxID=87 RepID=UPI003001DFDE
MAETPTLKFITLEGGEGTGKSTLQRALAKRLESEGFEVVTTREPGGTPLAEAVRQLALHPPAGGNWSPMSEALLMNAARRDHLENLIRPALAEGKWVICDRFADSTRVYQSVKGGVSPNVLKSMEASVLGETVPGLTLILDAPLETTASRRTSRNGPDDVFEKRAADFHHAVRQGFISLSQSEPDRCRLIDASRSEQDVFEAAWAVLAATYSLGEMAG